MGYVLVSLTLVGDSDAYNLFRIPVRDFPLPDAASMRALVFDTRQEDFEFSGHRCENTEGIFLEWDDEAYWYLPRRGVLMASWRFLTEAGFAALFPSPPPTPSPQPPVVPARSYAADDPRLSL